MASGQVSAPELEEDVKFEDEVHDEEDVAARESEVEKADVTKPVVEDEHDPFDVEEEVHGEDEEGYVGIIEVPTSVGAKVIGDDNGDDELDAEGEGASDEDAIHLH